MDDNEELENMSSDERPAELILDGSVSADMHPTFDTEVYVVGSSYTAAEARRLAAWLVRAARWIEGQGE